MVPRFVVIGHGIGNRPLTLGGQIVVAQLDKRLHGPMVALDLALGLGQGNREDNFMPGFRNVAPPL